MSYGLLRLWLKISDPLSIERKKSALVEKEEGFIDKVRTSHTNKLEKRAKKKTVLVSSCLFHAWFMCGSVWAKKEEECMNEV